MSFFFGGGGAARNIVERYSPCSTEQALVLFLDWKGGGVSTPRNLFGGRPRRGSVLMGFSRRWVSVLLSSRLQSFSEHNATLVPLVTLSAVKEGQCLAQVAIHPSKLTGQANRRPQPLAASETPPVKRNKSDSSFRTKSSSLDSLQTPTNTDRSPAPRKLTFSSSGYPPPRTAAPPPPTPTLEIPPPCSHHHHHRCYHRHHHHRHRCHRHLRRQTRRRPPPPHHGGGRCFLRLRLHLRPFSSHRALRHREATGRRPS